MKRILRIFTRETHKVRDQRFIEQNRRKQEEIERVKGAPRG
jgi:hypothetical protein